MPLAHLTHSTTGTRPRDQSGWAEKNCLSRVWEKRAELPNSMVTKVIDTGYTPQWKDLLSMVCALLIPKHFNIREHFLTPQNSLLVSYQPQTDGISEERCFHYASLAGSTPAATRNTTFTRKIPEHNQHPTGCQLRSILKASGVCGAVSLQLNSKTDEGAHHILL